MAVIGVYWLPAILKCTQWNLETFNSKLKKLYEEIATAKDENSH